MKKNIFKMTFLVLGGMLILPLATKAFSGTNASNARVKIYAEQGDDWFRAFTLRTDYTGVLEVNGMLPGWYKAEVDEVDEKASQTVALKARMFDLDGREINDNTNFDLYQRNASGNSVLIGTVETDKKGWLKVADLSADTEYKFSISERDNSSLSQKDGKMRVKCKAKIDESDWFSAYYGRTDENRVLEVINVLPGKYKFKYKESDGDITLPFVLSARILNKDGERLKEATKIHLWAYLGPEEVLTFAGEVYTNTRGEVVVPGLMHGIKYKIEVLEN